jgi:MFS transporter, NNP family, nitrate/nitrite transporter
MVAVPILAGAILRIVLGFLVDRIGGIRALYIFYLIAGVALLQSLLMSGLPPKLTLFMITSGALGMANGAVFQLLPQKFSRHLGIMTGLVGAGGGIGGFYLASSLGFSKGLTGSYDGGFLIFASLCFLAILGLTLVKARWRNTWGSAALEGVRT